MDTVDTLNHLIPSDQLDDTLITGQNLECEASNEFGTGLGLEDSLKNMLSDKDPMFGCTTTQFNLLDNEDPAFQIDGPASLDGGSASTGLSSELTASEITHVKQTTDRPKKYRSVNMLNRGRPGRKPANRLQRSFLIEKGVKGVQLKKELIFGGRININDLDGGLWLNPTVVLRRLTVTIGGFRIELLPGPSYAQSVDTSQSACFDDGFSYGGDIGFPILPDDAASLQNPMPVNVGKMDAIEKTSVDDSALGLGPYVNPNDVQTSNGTVQVSEEEVKFDNQRVPEKKKPERKGKEGVAQLHSKEDNAAKMDGKEKQHVVSKTQLKSKPGPASVKNKDLASFKMRNMIKEHKLSQNMPSDVAQRGDLHKMKSVKEKQNASSLKRPVENSQSDHPAKVQKMQGAGDSKVKPKLPSSPGSLGKKILLSGNRASDHQGPTKHNIPQNSAKIEGAYPTHSHAGNTQKTAEEGGQEKSKLKKPEKILQRQKSRSARSVSVDEPQLFIPDNAPAVKKEMVEEQPANNETAWDGNNCCGLCKKHHNNMFMVGCGRCDDWFHGDCVGLDLAKVHEMEEEDQMYVCLKCCEEETKKAEPEPVNAPKPEVQVKTEVQDHKSLPKPRPGSSQALTSGGVRPVKKEPDRRQDAREPFHKQGGLHKHDSKTKTPSFASKKPVSVEAIRRSVRDSLKEILIQRLKDSDLKISVERAYEVAKKTERELFHLYKDTDNKYKNKYRSLMFNLKDTKNNVLFKKVLRGEISPANLIRLSPEELASKELAAWRQRENRHTIEMIEKEQREAERRPITKITHKGEIEIESQEPVKAPEPVELEPPPKVPEVSVEPPKSPEKKPENMTVKDTTSQHKSHLFDLHCKICTGRMAPPVEEAQTKVVKVATTVVRRQSSKLEETKITTPSSVDDNLHLTVLEESFRNAKSGYEGRSDHATGRDEEATFLSSLKSLWRGFIHMHAVAKLVTKAFPVSGILDNLTEDLPDSIQVGGRISPQTVWDYLEKIRATGTKEVCLIRFSPETEEDEISYTLLYAYFSSRRRFGVVSNNLKQVKDMYLIPLGATEKVPHQLVPFDGPGLENNRANLLLGLIIRQRPKRDFLSVHVNESATIIPDIKPVAISTKGTKATEEEESLFLPSIVTSHKKEKEKPLTTTEEADESAAESFEEPSVPEETTNQDSHKPLRFLPGVLVGWGGELPPLPDVGGKPAAATYDTQKTQPVLKTEASVLNSTSPTATAPRERFVIKKKEAKPVKAEPDVSSPADTSSATNSSGKEAAAGTLVAPVSLKDKPPDVSTQDFLASLSAAPNETEGSSAALASKSATSLSSENEKGTAEGNSLLLSQSQDASSHTNSLKLPLSGILKKSLTYSTVNEDKMVPPQKDKASPPDPLSPKPVPVSSSTRNDLVLPFHQAYLQLSQAKKRPEIQNHTPVQSSPSQKDNIGVVQVSAVVTQTPCPPTTEEPQAACNMESSEPKHEPVKAPDQPLNDSQEPSIFQQAQVPGSFDDPTDPPPDMVFTLQTQDEMCSMQLGQDSTSPALLGLHSPQPESYPEPSVQPTSQGKDLKRLEERYSDPWERPRNTEDRDHHGRHSHHRDSHHVKKSRHHDREREKKHDRSHDDKYKERSRHHGHSDDRYGEKRKERHHSDDYSSRHKERHRHRRDSDYENGRRSSRDSYS
ncbi:uncharacterized protein phf3 [Pholidichthys leucotaenia]